VSGRELVLRPVRRCASIFMREGRHSHNRETTLHSRCEGLIRITGRKPGGKLRGSLKTLRGKTHGTVVENGADLAGQLFQGEWFLKKVMFGVDIMVQYGLAGIARDE